MKSAPKKNGKTQGKRSTKLRSTKSRKMIPNVLHDIRDDYLDMIGLDRHDCDDAKVLVVTGENAAGKSFLRRIFSHFIRENHKVEVMHLSQEGRAREGIERAFLYGAESEESTGNITAGTFTTGFRTSRGRDNDHILLWDEPEIGLAEEAQLGAAQFMVKQLADMPPKLRGLIVMTHSRHFVSTLMQVEGAKFVNLGHQYKTADEWLNRPIVPVDPETVRKRGHENMLKICAVMDKAKKEKNK